MPVASGVLSLSFVASQAGSNQTITIPVAGRAAGNLCIILNAAGDGNVDSAVLVTPSGFTAQQSDPGTGNRRGGIISTKVLNGTETTVSGINNASARWVVLVFQPTLAITGQTWTGNGEAPGTGNPSAQTISASGKATPCITVGQMFSDGAISPRSTSPTMDEVANGTTHFAHYFIYNPGDTPVNHSYDMDDEGTQNVMQSGVLVVS